MGGGSGERRVRRCGRCGGVVGGGGGGGGGLGTELVGVCEVGVGLKDASGGLGSVVVVTVVRRARKGRRNVGGRERGCDG